MQRGLYSQVNIIMPHNTTVYIIHDSQQLEAIWAYSLQRGLLMYHTHLDYPKRTKQAWVIEVPNTAVRTRFLLEFASSVTSAMGTYFI